MKLNWVDMWITFTSGEMSFVKYPGKVAVTAVTQIWVHLAFFSLTAHTSVILPDKLAFRQLMLGSAVVDPALGSSSPFLSTVHTRTRFDLATFPGVLWAGSCHTCNELRESEPHAFSEITKLQSRLFNYFFQTLMTHGCCCILTQERLHWYLSELKWRDNIS